MTEGRFIVIEGVEGVGKSTNISLVGDLLREAGREVVMTREPGGTGTGERIRQILLDRSETRMSAMTELLLMFAARVQHVEEVIRPALARGAWVVSDRFTDSSYAYQGGGRELGHEVVARVEQLSLGGFRPDLVLLLDLDVSTGLDRATRDNEADRFESEQLAFFERVRAAFLARAVGPGYRVIDASQPLEAVSSEIRRVIGEILQ